MKIQLHANLKVDDGRTMLAGVYEKKESEFPKKLQREIQHHRDGTQPKTTLTILQEDEKPATKKKSGSRKKRTSSANS